MTEDWKIISRKTNKPWWNLFAMLFGSLLLADNPGVHSSATWVVRNRSTGETRTITAESEQDMRDRLAAEGGGATEGRP
jgi:hypothetical protein